jgi:MFS family permease
MDQIRISKQRFFYGWIIAGIAFLNLAIAYGAQYSFGIFFPYLIKEFKWDRSSLAGAFSLYTFMYTILAVILGRLTDRFGPRIVLIFGSACLGTGIALISQVTALWHLYAFYGLMASWGMSATYITSNTTIVKWFIEKRGLALGLTQSGLGVGIIIIPRLSGTLIDTFGWRQALLILGAFVFIALFTGALFLIGDPEKTGCQPYGLQNKYISKSLVNITEAIYKEVSWSVSKAIRTKSFWVLTVIFFFTWLFVFFPLVHLVIFSMDIGLSRESAFMALSLLGGASALGRVIMGFLSDRIGKKQALIVNFGLQVFSWFWVMGTTTSFMLFLFATTFGFSYGGISAIFPAIIGDYFGRLKAGSIIGTIFTIAAIASAIGPLVAGYIYDMTHSYQLAFQLGAIANLISLALVFLSKPPKQS